MDIYKIGDICFKWEGNEYALQKGKYFEQFRIQSLEDLEEISFCAEIQPLEIYKKETVIDANYSYEIFQINDERLIIYHWAYCRFGFGVWVDRINADKTNTCYIAPKMLKDFPMNADWFFGLAGLHKAFLQKKAPILHGAYIEYKGEAILFTAPSQTGKSTQAKLWEQYASAQIINGDRVLLRKRDSIWHAYGYPICGSSDICINKTSPIRAIVVLRQAEYNEVVELSVSEKLRHIASAIEVYKWDFEEVELALSLAEDIVRNVTVLQLNCRPDSKAVYVLRDYLEAHE